MSASGKGRSLRYSRSSSAEIRATRSSTVRGTPARPYGTIHRIASDGTAKGMARFVFDWCAQQIDYLRIDTHENNRPMQAAVLRYGFQPCGVVQVRGGARLAFDYEVRA